MRSDHLLVLLGGLWVGCGQQALVADDLRVYLRDPSNGVFHEFDHGEYHISLQYVPIDLLAERELLNYEDVRSRDSIIAQYGDDVHFLLEIAKNGQDLVNAWILERGRGAQGPDLFSYGLKEHLVLDACGVRYQAQQCTYIRLFEIARSSSFLVSFHRPVEACESFKLGLGQVIDDLGSVSFQQSISALQNVPDLRLSSPY